jgi:hypothetical protein
MKEVVAHDRRDEAPEVGRESRFDSSVREGGERIVEGFGRGSAKDEERKRRKSEL